jgi:molybdopterin-guanine dinucleotide biosynthesis protein A
VVVPAPAVGFGAVVLSGGGGARLGGADKAGIEVGDRTLLEHALEAVVDAGEVVVVGPEVPTSRPVTFTREDPAGGGPAAGLVAGLRCFARPAASVVVLAVDMPLVSPSTVRRLLDAAEGHDGAVLTDEGGRRQYLCAVYRTAALARAQGASDAVEGHGLAMRDLVAGLDLATVAEIGEESRDLDTWADLAELRARFGEAPRPRG